MDNQHKKISGYRDLSEEEIALMNVIKAKGSELEDLLNQVSDKCDPINHPGHGDFLNWSDDMDRAETNLKQGIMWLVRRESFNRMLDRAGIVEEGGFLV